MLAVEENIRRRAEIVLEALSWLGTPYRHQASTKGHGTDCLGLVRGLYRTFVGTEPEALPPYAPRMAPHGGEPLLEGAERILVATETAQPGDIMLFRMRRSHPVSHCGVMVAPRRFIHAYEGRAVLTSAYCAGWRRRTAAVFSLPEIS